MDQLNKHLILLILKIKFILILIYDKIHKSKLLLFKVIWINYLIKILILHQKY